MHDVITGQEAELGAAAERAEELQSTMDHLQTSHTQMQVALCPARLAACLPACKGGLRLATQRCHMAPARLHGLNRSGLTGISKPASFRNKPFPCTG